MPATADAADAAGAPVSAGLAEGGALPSGTGGFSPEGGALGSTTVVPRHLDHSQSLDDPEERWRKRQPAPSDPHHHHHPPPPRFSPERRPEHHPEDDDEEGKQAAASRE